MVPDAAVLVIGHDHQHVAPLRALLEMRDDIGDVLVAGEHRRIARMLVEVALRLVKGDRRQGSGVDRLYEGGAVAPAVPEMRLPGVGSGRHVGEIVEWLMMIL